MNKFSDEMGADSRCRNAMPCIFKGITETLMLHFTGLDIKFVNLCFPNVSRGKLERNDGIIDLFPASAAPHRQKTIFSSLGFRSLCMSFILPSTGKISFYFIFLAFLRLELLLKAFFLLYLKLKSISTDM
jgi:hypothetical protein